MAICFGIYTLLLFWWQTVLPTNDKDWAPYVAQISHGKMQGGNIIMHNVRNFHYKTENIFMQHWETRSYDLNKIQGVDLFLSYSGSGHIAHPILSWDFGDDGHLAISIEARLSKTQEYSLFRCFFKQFETSYIAADERDIIRLRTNLRKERVHIYKLQASRHEILALLEAYLEEMNKLVNQPEFYNVLRRNCIPTLKIQSSTSRRSEGGASIDWRLWATGHVDELLYDRSLIVTTVPFADMRKLSRIDLKMQLEGREEFSAKMREYTEVSAGPEKITMRY